MYWNRVVSSRQLCNFIKLKLLTNNARHVHQHSTKTIRNIGILAHIDAGKNRCHFTPLYTSCTLTIIIGKTTTTERMLFYSGKTSVLGEVHYGTTVTDCLAQERERGITICSSAVSFDWNDCRVNLLDTPGHIDFTMEVEQSLSAVDGVCIILDASAGVEAQTITVWTQADQHKLPRIAFANKMDRSDADFAGTVKDLEQKLNAVPAVLQWPIIENGKLKGIIDIVTKQQLTFVNEGRKCSAVPLSSPDLTAFVDEKRSLLIDTISGFDDTLADLIISNDSLVNVNAVQLSDAIRRATIDQKVVPVLLGSAYKNSGVQPLMDAVIQYLPSPSDRKSSHQDYFEQVSDLCLALLSLQQFEMYSKLVFCRSVFLHFSKDFVGKVFKVAHDKQKGALSLVRILSGKLRKGTKVVTSRGNSEIIQKMYEALADEYREIQDIGEGDIVVCGGLKVCSPCGYITVASIATT